MIGACTGRPDRSDIETLVRDALPTGFRSSVYLLSRRPLNDWVASIARTAEIYYPELTYANAVAEGMRRVPSRRLFRAVLDGAMSVYLDRFLNVPAAPLPETSSSCRRTRPGCSTSARLRNSRLKR